MKTLVKWGCSAASCLCCGLLAAVGTTVGGAAMRHQSVGRALYLALLLAFMTLAWIMFNLPTWIDSAHYISSLPSFMGCDGTSGVAAAGDATRVVEWILQHEFGTATLSVPERLCYGTLSVMRVLMPLSVFHAAAALLMIGATSADKAAVRYELQHGWWAIKGVLLLLAVVASFVALGNGWVLAYYWVAFVGSLAFILTQILLLIEFAHRTSQSLAEGYRRAAAVGRAGRCVMGVGMMALVIACYAGAVALLVMSMTLAASQGTCRVAWLITTSTCVLCVLVTVFALAAFKSQRGGIAPAAVVVLYGAYLTWSALSPMALRDIGCEPVTTTGAADADNDDDAPGIVYVSRLMGLHNVSRDAQHFILLGTAFLALLYATVRTSTRLAETTDDGPDTERSSMRVALDEEDDADAAASPPESPRTVPPYNFSMFHVIFFLASCYAAMVLTGWSGVEIHALATNSTDATGPTPALAPPAATVFVNHTTASLWIKVLSAWVTLLLYTWTACAPLVCRHCRKTAPA